MISALKKIFNKKTLKIIWLIYSLCSMALVLYLTDHMFSSGLDETTDKVLLNDNWEITINDEQYENVNLDSLHFEAVDKGDDIIMTTMLPDDWSFEEPVLCLHIRQTTVSIFVDNETIYEYGHERAINNDTVGSGIQLINFSNEYKGKELKIVLGVSENNAFAKFDSIWLSEWEDSYRFVLTENRLPFFLGAFLIVFGVVVTFLLIFAVALSTRYINILWISIFSICIGLWTLCYYNVILVFDVPLYSVSLIEYMSLLMAPIPIVGYMYSYVEQLRSKKLMLCYKVLFAVQLVFTVVTIALHATDIVHSAELLVYHHILFLIHSFFSSYVLYRSTKLNKKRRNIYSVGLVVVLICVIYDLSAYAFNRYFGYQLLGIKGVSSLGIIVFIAILLLDLYQDVTLRKMEEHEKKLLIKRAYTDDLTQINNRGYCSEYMNKLQADENSKYTILSLDLNDLKKTNDTYGHAKGDLLIKTAAKVISDAFSDGGTVGRMGGDEFIAILPTDDATEVEALVKSFANLIDEANNEALDLNLSISYGYATCNEVAEKSIEKVYKLADNRMYEYKKKSKETGI